MEFWDQPYYRVVKYTSILAGQWPWQSPTERIIFRSILSFFVGSILLSQVRAAIRYKTDTDYLMEMGPFFVIEATCLTKMINSILHLNDIQILLVKIRGNWQIFSGGHQNEILYSYSKLGYQWSMLYLGTLYIGMALCSTQPLQSQLLHIILHANGSLPHQFSLPTDYGSIDSEKYYYIVILVSGFTILCCITILVATDVVFYTCCAHICGLFEALGYTLESFTFEISPGSEDAGFLHLRRCIQIHTDLLEFANVMEKSFHWTFFVMLGSCTLALSMTAVQAVIDVAAATKLFKQFVFAITQISQLFIKCWFAQRVMDHSLEFRVHVADSKWYLGTKKAQGLAGLMMMRGQIPCKITAGKITTMSLATFAAVMYQYFNSGEIVRVSVSYFTAFLALR